MRGRWILRTGLLVMLNCGSLRSQNSCPWVYDEIVEGKSNPRSSPGKDEEKISVTRVFRDDVALFGYHAWGRSASFGPGPLSEGWYGYTLMISNVRPTNRPQSETLNSRTI